MVPPADMEPQVGELTSEDEAEVNGEEVNEEDLNEEDVRKAALLDEELPKPEGFIVALTRGGKFRRLHFAGGCFRQPGVHYRNFVDLGQAQPELGAIDARCKDCFPKGVGKQDLPDEVSASSSDSSSSSSSSAEAEIS